MCDAEQLTLCKTCYWKQLAAEQRFDELYLARHTRTCSTHIRTCTTAWPRRAEFAAFGRLGQVLTQRFLHVIFHGRKQELFCRGSEQTKCQLLAGKYHFQPHLQSPTDVSAFQRNRNFMDHFLLFSCSLGRSSRPKCPTVVSFGAGAPADMGDKVKPLSCG